MYVSMKDILYKANNDYYGVLAINCFNLETARAVISAAEEMHSPIIVNLLEEHLKAHFNIQYLTAPIIKMANDAKVEVAINLDHGKDVSFVKQCLHAGFSSVMMDGSMYPIEKNIEITKEIVKFSEQFNACVEAEVGTMGGVGDESWGTETMFTNIEEAIRLIKETNVDCLALSYGSAHGDYPDGVQPEFNFEIVKEIKEATKIPLVLHGGSGAGEKNIRKSVELGINKINVGSDFMKGQLNRIKEILIDAPNVEYPYLINSTIDAGKEVVKHYIKIVGSENKSL